MYLPKKKKQWLIFLVLVGVWMVDVVERSIGAYLCDQRHLNDLREV